MIRRYGPDEVVSAHTEQAIASRLAGDGRTSNLRDFVYGAVDGTVTTFAVVAGVAGAELRPAIVVILGFANLIADGFSMAASNFLATKADLELKHAARRKEAEEVELVPEGEREEIRQIFAAKGFAGEDLERVVDVITSDRELWIETMMVEELGFPSEDANPAKAALATFVAFVVVGFLPLFAFVMELWAPTFIGDPFVVSSVMTGIAFFLVGAAKSFFVDRTWWLAGLETLGIGGAAASLAYIVGVLLKGIAG